MKLYTFILCIFLMFALLLTAASCSGKQEECFRLYVSPLGSDSGTGSEAQPFLTAARALEEVKTKLPLTSDIEVIFEEGVYDTGELLFGDVFSEGEYFVSLIGRGNVVFSAGINIPLSDFHPAENGLLPAETVDHIVCVSLAGYGVTEYPAVTEVGFAEEYGTPSYEFFFGGEALTLARYPNDSYLKALGAGTDAETAVITDIEQEKLLFWSAQEDGYIRGFFYHDWADDTLRIDGIDVAGKTIVSDSQASYGVRAKARYFIQNYLSELDAEGEWFLDRESGIFYVWLPDNNAASVTMTYAIHPILSLSHANNLCFQNIVFEGSRANLAVLESANKITFESCVFRNAGVMGLSCEDTRNTVITDCHFYDIGLKAIEIEGGDRKTLSPSGNVISNCSFTKTGRNVSSMECVRINGVGNTFTHNEMFDLPHSAINFGGNDNRISYNEIRNACYDTTDSGVIYAGRNYTYGGNTIEYNYIHNIKPHIAGTLGASEALLSTSAIYLDDLVSGITVQNNILVSAGRGVFLGGGKNNTVFNNVFLDNIFTVYADNRGETWESYHVENNALERRLFDTKLDIRNSPLWLTRFPYLTELIAQYDNGDTAGIYAPSGNVIKNNLNCGAGFDFIMDSVIRHGEYRASEETDRYGLFVDPDNGDYTFRSDWNHNAFNKIPFGETGIV